MLNLEKWVIDFFNVDLTPKARIGCGVRWCPECDSPLSWSEGRYWCRRCQKTKKEAIKKWIKVN